MKWLQIIASGGLVVVTLSAIAVGFSILLITEDVKNLVPWRVDHPDYFYLKGNSIARFTLLASTASILTLWLLRQIRYLLTYIYANKFISSSSNRDARELPLLSDFDLLIQLLHGAPLSCFVAMIRSFRCKIASEYLMLCIVITTIFLSLMLTVFAANVYLHLSIQATELLLPIKDDSSHCVFGRKILDPCSEIAFKLKSCKDMLAKGEILENPASEGKDMNMVRVPPHNTQGQAIWTVTMDPQVANDSHLSFQAPSLAIASVCRPIGHGCQIDPVDERWDCPAKDFEGHQLPESIAVSSLHSNRTSGTTTWLMAMKIKSTNDVHLDTSWTQPNLSTSLDGTKILTVLECEASTYSVSYFKNTTSLFIVEARPLDFAVNSLILSSLLPRIPKSTMTKTPLTIHPGHNKPYLSFVNDYTSILNTFFFSSLQPLVEPAPCIATYSLHSVTTLPRLSATLLVIATALYAVGGLMLTSAALALYICEPGVRRVQPLFDVNGLVEVLLGQTHGMRRGTPLSPKRKTHTSSFERNDETEKWEDRVGLGLVHGLGGHRVSWIRVVQRNSSGEHNEPDSSSPEGPDTIPEMSGAA